MFNCRVTKGQILHLQRRFEHRTAESHVTSQISSEEPAAQHNLLLFYFFLHSVSEGNLYLENSSVVTSTQASTFIHSPTLYYNIMCGQKRHKLKMSNVPQIFCISVCDVKTASPGLSGSEKPSLGGDTQISKQLLINISTYIQKWFGAF